MKQGPLHTKISKHTYNTQTIILSTTKGKDSKTDKQIDRHGSNQYPPHDLLLQCAMGHQAIHIHNPLLSNAMGSVHCLKVSHWIPVVLHKNNLKSFKESMFRVFLGWWDEDKCVRTSCQFYQYKTTTSNGIHPKTLKKKKKKKIYSIQKSKAEDAPPTGIRGWPSPRPC